MSSVTLTDATLEKLEKLTSSFAVLALAIKQSSDEFKSAALEFSNIVEAARSAASATVSSLPPPINTATPAAEKVAKAIAEEAAVASAPASPTALPIIPGVDTDVVARYTAAGYTATSIETAARCRDLHFKEMERYRQMYHEQYKTKFNNELLYKYNRLKCYFEGCIRMIGGKRVLIYKYHAFEMPTDRSYKEPGPLTWLGAIDPDTKRIRHVLMVPPILPTTAENWPWH